MESLSQCNCLSSGFLNNQHLWLCLSPNVSDGVQEVAYIHSNQKVVGSSKAENCLSRWAVRDVFELKQFSQLPANVAVCSAKVKRNVWEILVVLCYFFPLFFFFKKLVLLLMTTKNDQGSWGWEEEAHMEV